METWREHAFLIEGEGRCVPEPFVKQLLARIGVSVPSGVVVPEGGKPSEVASGLKPPLVLKAWGPGLVHKSDVGAVRVRLSLDELDDAAESMLAEVSGHGLRGSRLYVEEMAPAGTEILFGVVARPPFGNLAVLGCGGVYAELFGEPAMRLLPLTRDDALEMIREFPGAKLLAGYRGGEPADSEALADAMVAIAGQGGLIDSLGSEFAEFECNPLFAGPRGAFAADARLILRTDTTVQPSSSGRDFDAKALFLPKCVAVVGASTSRARAWGNRTLARYRDMGWTENLYAVHPKGDIEGFPTFRSLADIPGGVDYAEISVGSEAVAEVLRSAKGNLKTCVITSAGFSEMGGEGIALEEVVREAAIEGGVRAVGPNCMGVFSPRGRQGFSGATGGEPGGVAGVFQSGALSTDLIQIGHSKGLKFSGVASIGNSVDVRMSELFAYFLDDPVTRTIALYVEGGVDTELVQLLHKARGRKPVVLLAPGLSSVGARVAASHTGALTSDRKSWEALSRATGFTLVESLEEMVACVLYLEKHSGRFDLVDESVLIMGLGGGASVMSADACDAAGLDVPVLPKEIQARLGDKKGGILINPLDLRMGPAGPPSTARDAIETVIPSVPCSDVLVHVNMLAYSNSMVANRLPGMQHFEQMLASLTDDPELNSRVAVVLRNSVHAPGEFLDEAAEVIKASSLPVFDRISDSAVAIASAKRFSRHRKAVS